ncbi:hypothetical protein OGAPHI_002074 [Ogataea philodendri]|uniref:Nucleoporin NUP188 n=1 Tax=Ogataea philodendri TaxID=1378263 RepID=A0A9P8PB44_9ASCO|nr:uncharacterized protein OGAPHI_002074 [Ogataea philodendri]KAH3668320.1 hypothetical protein OGAPHI_002074 [Ogataea philodendri]
MTATSTVVPVSDLAVNLNWTFQHAYLLLVNGESDSSVTQYLCKFFKSNKKYLLVKHLPFNSKSGKTVSDDFQIDSRVVRNNLTAKQKEYATQISDKLRLDVHEVARIVQIAMERIIDEAESESSGASSLQTIKSGDLVSFLYFKVLQEVRAVLKTQLYLIKNEYSLSPELQDLCLEIKQVAYQLLESYIENLLEWNTSQLGSIGKGVQKELELLTLDVLNVLAYLIFKTGTGFTKKTALNWFRLMKNTSYRGLLVNAPDETTDKRILNLESICTVLSLVMLDLDFNFGGLGDEESFTNDPEVFSSINDYILGIHANPIVLYGWSIILHRKHLVIANNKQHPVSIKLIEKFGGLDNIQRIYLSCAKKAASLDVCAAIITCQETVSYDDLYIAILASFVVSFVPYIQLNDEITLAINKTMTHAPNKIVERFFQNPATEDLMAIARAKLPLSIKSFIRLISINTNLAYEELANLKSYMEIFKEEEFYYKYLIDDENPQLIKLTQDLDILPPYETPGELSLLLKEGTKAQIFPGTNKDDVVVAFLYDYNGWTLLGRIIKNLSKSLDSNPEKTELASEIFQLVSKVSRELEKEQFDEVIRAMSSFVDDLDVIEVIFRVLEQGLQLRLVNLLQSGFELLSSLSRCGYSFRIWSYLYKSQILGLKVNAGLANTILGTVEMVEWKYGFSISLLKLTLALLDDCFVISNDVNWKLKSEVLDRLTAHCIHIYGNYMHWRYTDEIQRLQIGTYSQKIFMNIITSVYGIENGTPIRDKVTRLFAQSCERITKMFLVPDIQVSTATRPILETLRRLSSSVFDLDTSGLHGLWQQKFLDSLFEYATSLVAIRSSYQGTLSSSFEKDLYSIVPELVSLYASTMCLRTNILRLLSSLVNSRWENEPPSLLTHLGQEHTHLFLRCLAADISNEFESHDMKIALYDFFSSVMVGDQEGLSIVLITGRDIKDCILDEKKTFSKEDKVKKSQYSLLKILKNSISNISTYSSDVSLKLVEALALAFNSWTTAKEDDDDDKFVNNLISEVTKFPDAPTAHDETTLKEHYYQVNRKAKMAEIMSLYLFVSQNTATKQKIYNLLNSKEFTSNLRANFELRSAVTIPTETQIDEFWIDGALFKLSQFERSPVFARETYGADASHALDLMDKLFHTSPEWSGIRQQVVSSSLGFQMMSAHVTAAKSFGALVTCFCKNDGPSVDLSYINLATSLLKINEVEGIISPEFAIVYQERIDLVFFICLTFSKRRDKKLDDKLIFPLISSVCQLLLSDDINLTSGLFTFEVQNYRPLLRTLLIALNMIKDDTMLFVEYGATFADIFTTIISKSLKTIFKSIQTEVMSSRKEDYGGSLLICKQADDITLLVNILGSLLSHHLPRDLELALARSVIDAGLFRSTANLYSISHLVKINKDVIFADVALKIFNELVRVKVIAEKMLGEGLFMVLIDSQISVQIQRGGISPVSAATAHLHHLWVEGLLSTVLTLISSFGDRITSEIYLFVKSFSKQFQTTLLTWLESNSSISLATVHETSQIIFLAEALNVLDVYSVVRVAGSESVKLIPGLDTKDERLNLVSGLNYLLSHPKFLSSRVVASSQEEQKQLDTDKNRFVDQLLEEIKQLKNMLLD